MPEAKSVSWPLLLALVAAPGLALGQTPGVSPAPVPAGSTAVAEPRPRPPFVVGVAIDEVGTTRSDLGKSATLVLSVFDALPQGSLMALATFRGEQRIALPPTADRELLAAALARFEPGPSGVALPDGLFDVVDFLGGVEAAARGVLLVSAGRVREGDLQFEDPLNAATSRDIPIVTLGLGQGDGRLLRRIAKITGGDYIRLEVADPSMLAHALLPRGESAPPMAPRDPLPTPTPAAKASAGLLGAAAIFLALGGLLILGTIVLLIRRMNSPKEGAVRVPDAPVRAAPPRRPLAGPEAVGTHVETDAEDDPSLEKTLVVNANPILRALSGPGAGKNFPLSPSGTTAIGRSRRNDIVVPEDGASAQHCKIDREGDSYVLHDLGATNGTWVNGARTDRAVLKHGDRLKVGDTVFTVSLFGDRT